ncbi:diphosphate--fructose-6-phosphate 1-phosphotransferase [Nitratireductor sp. ZSWI3]|uniref:diphosphate--fructose-6-phosphate 1-phosphotransferase n=1 Tax=Nitratireductor sp. ZSWI3 TaxID=2966359 RepID=UPI00214FF9E2|nr:diphosphate--fructose-6-phosphate 1-phosphotransferase [Nitratireductor sp. ZSWI3]MCR4266816.1 diphosphate--fructose-6-phosphate 1-phosphotransferase [Nitratireductor sp. ZSWI3]
MSVTIVIAQGGGPTAVINQTVVGATLEARRRYPGSRVLGALHGVRGVRDGRFVTLSDLPEAELMRIAATPSAALGSTRDKPDAAYCETIMKGLKGVGADAFINIGGNDTSGTQAILRDASGGGMTFMHAPKTIDNDLMESDHTPGFISAAEMVAGAFLSVDLDFRALPGIYVGIVMGRHAGFLTASGAAWTLDEESGPHLIYVPERPFERKRFIDDVKTVFHRRGRCIVAMSEGVADAEGRSLVETLVPPELQERDAHGNLKLSGSDLGQAIERILAEDMPGRRARVDTFGYLPRGNIATVNGTDAREAFEAGAFAVASIEQGDGSVALEFDGEKTVCRAVDLNAVAGKTRVMPDDFLHLHENRISDTGRAYFERLLPRRYDPARPFV